MKPKDIEQLNNWAIDYVWTPRRSWDVLTGPEGFHTFTEGKGCRIKDSYGKEYIDYWSSVMFSNTGYGNEEISEAAYKQMLTLHGVPTHDLSIPKIELAKKLAEITPGALTRTFFTNSGTEAIETAMKMARQYQRLSGYPNRYKAIVPGYRYHGSTYGAMSLGGRAPIFSWDEFVPLLPGVIHIPSPYCFRCDLGLNYSDCDIRCARQMEWVIEMEGADTIAYFLDVTIATEYCTTPPPEYWPMIRSICDKHGILLILDEVVNGFGRNGKMFACNHWDITPDILVVAKGLGSGYVPLGAAIATKNVAKKFEGGPKETFKHGVTFEGSPAACAASLANLHIIERDKLVENSLNMGNYLFDSLQSLQKHRIIGEIRGQNIGLMCDVGLVKDHGTNRKFSIDENKKLLGILKKELKKAGLWGMVDNPLPLFPPLNIDKGEIDELVSRLDKAISAVEKALS
jgi:adenosylmethionine-8-amino-7-oxononanoate aminotransferase